MPASLLKRTASVLLPVALVGGYVGVMGSTGRCVACETIVNSAVSLTGLAAPDASAEPSPGSESATSDGSPESQNASGAAEDATDDFRRVRRQGSVDIDAVYDLTDPRIPVDEIHTLLPRDAIPALTDPATTPAGTTEWLPDEARIIAVTIGEGDAAETLGVPLLVLNWHEIVNATVGGEPVAVTYCPLCDSATAFVRTVETESGPETLEFGVSGALYNSNVLLYDRTHMGLWSQLAMEAVTGPSAGTVLEMLPIRLLTFGAFKAEFPRSPVVSDQTGHERSYDWDKRPYQDFFAHDRTLVPVRTIGESLPKKTLGLGIATGSRMSGSSWFVPALEIGDEGLHVDTPAGVVEGERTEAGLIVRAAPDGVRTAQSFYYAWSAFYPRTVVVGDSD